jgi:predicted GTPase
MSNILIIGESGVGKTTTFNFLTNSNNPVSEGINDCTLVCSKKPKKSNHNIFIIDTPGIKTNTIDDWLINLKEHCDVNHILNGTNKRLNNNQFKLLF